VGLLNEQVGAPESITEIYIAGECNADEIQMLLFDFSMLMQFGEDSLLRLNKQSQ